MYMHATYVQAYLARGASVGRGEAAGGGSGRKGMPTTSGHRAVAVVVDGGEDSATCEG